MGAIACSAAMHLPSTWRSFMCFKKIWNIFIHISKGNVVRVYYFVSRHVCPYIWVVQGQQGTIPNIQIQILQPKYIPPASGSWIAQSQSCGECRARPAVGSQSNPPVKNTLKIWKREKIYWKFKKRDLCVKNLKKVRNTLEIWKREIHVVLVGLGTHCTYLNPYLYLYLICICICMTKITWCLFVLASWLAYCIFCSSEDLCRESAAIRSFPISFLNKKAWNQCFKEKCHQNQGKGEGSLLRRVSSHL